jgi:LPPG:FO 2-phospho-L-lactate transferase
VSGSVVDGGQGGQGGESGKRGHVVALSGGVGGAKLVHGLALALPPGSLTAIVNTGDDFVHLGLPVSPDLDSVLYALAGLSDAVRGWGRRDETWTFMAALKGLGGPGWFNLGDGDLAMHVLRRQHIDAGDTLTQAMARIAASLGVDTTLLPMSDDPVRTRVRTDEGWLDFQEYFVGRQCVPAVREVAFEGAKQARAQSQALAALARSDLRAIVICPSNPYLSVDPLLALPQLRAALQSARAAGVPVIAVSPLVGGKAIKGPAAKLMAELGLEVTNDTIARHYAGLASVFVSDESDPPPVMPAAMRGLRAQTVMRGDVDRRALADAVLAAGR